MNVSHLKKRIELPLGHYSAGRTHHSDIIIENSQLSRRHVEIKVEQEIIYIRDLATTNGTFKNGERLRPNIWSEVSRYDDIRLGQSYDVSLKLSILGDQNVYPLEKKIEQPISRPVYTQGNAALKSDHYADIGHDIIVSNENAKKTAQNIINKAKNDANKLKENVKNKLLEVNIELDQLQQQKKKEIKEIGLLLERKDKTRIKIDDFEQKLNQLQIDKEKLQLDISKQSETYKESKKSHFSKLESLKFKVLEKENELNSVKTILDDKKVEASDIELAISKLNKEKNILFNDYDHLQQRIKTIYEDLNKGQNDLDELKLKSEQEEVSLNTILSEIEKNRQILSNLNRENDAERKNQLLALEKQENEFKKIIEIKQKESIDFCQKNKTDALEIIENAKQLEKMTLERVNTLEEDAQTKARSIIDTAENEARRIQNEVLKIKETQEEENKKIIEKIKYESSQKRETLTQELKELKESAENDAHQILVEAKSNSQKESQTLIANAQITAQKILENAQLNVATMHKDALSSIESKNKELEQVSINKNQEIKDMLQVLDELSMKKENLLEIINNEREEMLKEIQIKNDEIKNETIKQCEEIKQNFIDEQKFLENSEKEKLNEYITQEKSHLEIEKENLSQHIESEKNNIKIEKEKLSKYITNEKEKLTHFINKEKDLLNKLRATEVQNLKELKRSEENKLISLKESLIEELSQGVDSILKVKFIKMNLPVDIKDELDQEFKNIGHLIKSKLNGKKDQNDDLVELINPFQDSKKGKSIKNMKKVSIAFGVVLLTLLIHLIFPSIYESIKSNISSLISVDKSAHDLYSEGIIEKRKARPKFNPEKTKSFKANLTENILHTNNFAKIWLSDDFQRFWAVKVDELIVFKLELKDQSVIKYITTEFALIRELQLMSEKIQFETQDAQILVMKKYEEEKLEELYKILESKNNYLELQRIQKESYEFWLKSSE